MANKPAELSLCVARNVVSRIGVLFGGGDKKKSPQMGQEENMNTLAVTDPLVELARTVAGNVSTDRVSGAERARICQEMCAMLGDDGRALIERDNPGFCPRTCTRSDPPSAPPPPTAGSS